VDEKNGLIVHTEALSHSQDYNKLQGQVAKAGEVLGSKPEIVSCDCGYYSLDDLAKVDSNITVVIPSIRQAQREKDLHPLKPFGKEQFQYDQEHDHYICPAGKCLAYNGASPTGSKSYYKARQRDCHACRLFGLCTRAKQGRVIARMREEELQERLKNIYQSPQGQAVYRLRKQKVELPFGHFKRNLLAGHFLLRGRSGATAELSLLATCFNLTRMMTLLGIPNLLAKLAVKQAVLQSA
jgi:Transposase DDE domain